MPARRILELGDPILRQVSLRVEDPFHARLLLRDLDATLRDFRSRTGWGRGISAVQIGELQRVIFIRMGDALYELINPEYTWRSDERFELWDDCFSFPNLMVFLERHRAVRVRYQTVEGESREFEASGDLSELVQHEMDHLDGILAVDRVIGQGLATRAEWQRRYRP